jgi:hypothetical protein
MLFERLIESNQSIRVRQRHFDSFIIYKRDHRRSKLEGTEMGTSKSIELNILSLKSFSRQVK